MRKLLDRMVGLLKARGRTTARRLAGDLFSEEASLPADDRQTVLDEIRRTLGQLQAEFNQAIVREENARQIWEAAREGCDRLEAAADQALCSGQDDTAREILARLVSERSRADSLERSYREAGELRAYWSREIAQVQPRIDRLAGQLRQLEERSASLENMEAWDRDRRGWHKQLDELQESLNGLEARVAVREDRMAARQDLRRGDLPGKLSSAAGDIAAGEGKEVRNDVES